VHFSNKPSYLYHVFKTTIPPPLRYFQKGPPTSLNVSFLHNLPQSGWFAPDMFPLKKDEVISQIEQDYQESAKELTSLRCTLKNVCDQRDVFCQESKQLRNTISALQNDVASLKQKIKSLDEDIQLKENEILLREGEISILRDSIAKPCDYICSPRSYIFLLLCKLIVHRENKRFFLPFVQRYSFMAL
jgi:hypothetical protein